MKAVRISKPAHSKDILFPIEISRLTNVFQFLFVSLIPIGLLYVQPTLMGKIFLVTCLLLPFLITILAPPLTKASLPPPNQCTSPKSVINFVLLIDQQENHKANSSCFIMQTTLTEIVANFTIIEFELKRDFFQRVVKISNPPDLK